MSEPSTDLEPIRRLLEVERWSEADTLLMAALASRPDDPELHFLAARLADRTGDRERTQTHIARALAADPQHVGARLMAFYDQLEDQEFDRAEQTIVELIRELPDEPAVIAMYGELLLFTGHLDKARALLEEARRLDPEHRAARRLSALLFTIRGQRRQASAELQSLFAEDPESRRLSELLLVVLLDQDRYREAAGLAQELLRADPTNDQLVDMVVELRAATHWVALPAYPLRRWGWLASAGMWVGLVVVVGLRRSTDSPWTGWVIGLYLLYAVYSWTHMPLLQRWLRWRGWR